MDLEFELPERIARPGLIAIETCGALNQLEACEIRAGSATLSNHCLLCEAFHGAYDVLEGRATGRGSGRARGRAVRRARGARNGTRHGTCQGTCEATCQGASRPLADSQGHDLA